MAAKYISYYHSNYVRRRHVRWSADYCAATRHDSTWETQRQQQLMAARDIIRIIATMVGDYRLALSALSSVDIRGLRDARFVCKNIQQISKRNAIFPR
jgi:hypothetical protein